MNTEKIILRYKPKEITCTVKRNARRKKTVALRPLPDERMVVDAPKAMPIGEIIKVLHKRKDWIVERFQWYQDNPLPPVPSKFITG